MFLGLNTQRRLRFNIEGNNVSTTGSVKLLAGETENKLKFDKHVRALCSKTNMTIYAFTRLSTHISREQAILICNAIILSNFNYCSSGLFNNFVTPWGWAVLHIFCDSLWWSSGGGRVVLDSIPWRHGKKILLTSSA